MKTNRDILFIVFIVLCFSVKAQNLAPNYSFEQLLKCTTNCYNFNGYVANWTGQGESEGLDYYTAQCPGDTGSGSVPASGNVPYNDYYGFQYAHTGISYAGIITFADGSLTNTNYPYANTVFANVRSYLEAKLIDSLKASTIYYVTFFVNLQNSCDYACNDVGAYFSSSYIPLNNTTFPSGPVLPYTPQVANNPKKQKLTDTLNWMKVSGSFIAKGGEQYIVIGNFKNDSLSNILYIGQVSSNMTEADYYVDDVIVSIDSNYADSLFAFIPSISQPKEIMQVYPNPSDGIFNFAMQNINEKAEIDVYNTIGKKVCSTTLDIPQKEGFVIDLSYEAKGLYLYRITGNEGNLIATGKLIKQ